MSDFYDITKTEGYKEYQEFWEREKAARMKEGYAEGYVCARSAFPIAYVLNHFNLDAEVIYASLLEEALKGSSVSKITDEIIKAIQNHENLIKGLKENGYTDAIEKLNEAYDKIPKDNEEMDYDHARRVLRDLISRLAVLLALKGFSQEEIIAALIKTKFFSANFDDYSIFLIYEEGWEKLLRHIIETIPDGLRKKYAKTMYFPYWIVETLVKQGNISEDILRKELDKVIDFGWSCVEGFAKLGYPVKQTKNIFPDDFVTKKIEEEMGENKDKQSL